MKRSFLIILLLIALTRANNQNDHSASSSLIGVNWHHVERPFLLSCWLLLACVARILFHLNKKFGNTIPDSALLIAVGLLLGFILNFFQVSHQVFRLPSEIFFLYLLPPIIYDASYFMPVRDLFENAGSVCVFSVFGTIWNAVAIGTTLAVFGHFNFFSVNVNIENSFLFASLISTVDPVAVITTFEEMHVSEHLFIAVFGEALFNDGVAEILFKIFQRASLIGLPNLEPTDYISFAGSLFAVAFGGVLIGILFAVICAIATKYTVGHVKIVGPVFVFVIPFLAYLTAEIFELSAILSLSCCVIGMKQYVKGNLSHEAASSVKYFVKMISQTSESVVFMFLGLSTMSSDLVWDWWFIAVTLISCLVYRALGVIIQCGILNFFRTRKFTIAHQIIMSYGGLRGAIAFGLLSSVPNQVVAKDIFTTTSLVVICVTNFVQGTTVRPLLHFLKVETKEEMEESMAYFDYTIFGIEDIIAQHSRNSFRDWFERTNSKLIKPILMRGYESQGYDATTIIRAYQKIAITDAMNMIKKAENPAYKNGTKGESKKNRMVTVNIEEPVITIEPKQTEAELYDMFNELLDKRLAEFRRDPIPNTRDDIRDEYRAVYKNYDRYQHQLTSHDFHQIRSTAAKTKKINY
ncbi:Sodium/hydrogen exchanger [Aphelenchoides besseyi]|nr:Sodium/hydrogen exchanger [Aphelenchoides besseyi]